VNEIMAVATGTVSHRGASAQAVATAKSVTPKQTISQRLLTASIGKNACDMVILEL